MVGRPRVRVVQMDDFRGLFGIRKKNRVVNALKREVCGGMKEVGEIICECSVMIRPYWKNWEG